MGKYEKIIQHIFDKHYTSGGRKFRFKRTELESACKKLKIRQPKNLGDIVYTFRYRKELPDRIKVTEPAGKEWIIKPAGDGIYQFELCPEFRVEPNKNLEVIKIPDATPGIIAKYAQSDEQALLAKLRYNRLLDIFLGITCYSLQNHLRTKVKGVGQIEIDELYIAIRKSGLHYIVPVQAKGGSDKLGRIQIEQDLAYAASKFPNLPCKPVGAQFMGSSTIALFEFVRTGKGDLAIRSEKHYRLVPPDDLTAEDLASYSDSEE
ncbi:MAG: endonuclease [Armatimonadetes bacterium]|nr:endonuclease [Armatimonadota bacterium]